jgi:hypothetical protein
MGSSLVPSVVNPAMPPLASSLIVDGVLSTVGTITKTTTIPVGAHIGVASAPCVIASAKMSRGETFIASPNTPTAVPITATDTSVIVASPSDGTGAIAKVLPTSQSWGGVAYGNGIFVAVPATAGTAGATSTDGVTWSAQVLPTSMAYLGIKFANGIFVAYGASTNYITSTDGLVWTARTGFGAGTGIQTSLTVANNIFFTSSTATTTIYSSTDGITWTARTLPSSASGWGQVAYGNGVYAALGQTSTVGAYSYDAVTWFTATTVPAGTFVNIAFGNGVFVGIGNASSFSITSTDGITWVNGLTVTVNSSLQNDLVFAYGWFCFTQTGSVALAYFSKDGKNWATRTLTAALVWSRVCVGKGIIVYLPNNATNTVINCSYPAAPVAPVSFGLYAAPTTIN